MWAPRRGTFHYGRTEADYSNLIALHERYKRSKPPIEELKQACLADGYPPEKVARMRYPDTSGIDVYKLLRGIEQDFPDDHSDDDQDSDTSDSDDDDHSNVEPDCPSDAESDPGCDDEFD